MSSTNRIRIELVGVSPEAVSAARPRIEGLTQAAKPPRNRKF